MFNRLLARFSRSRSPRPSHADDAKGDVDVNQVAALVAAGAVVVDVREPDEFAAGSVPGARNIPLGELAARLDEIPRGRTIACLCRSGARSARAREFLLREGYEAVNLGGGMLAWRGQ